MYKCILCITFVVISIEAGVSSNCGFFRELGSNNYLKITELKVLDTDLQTVSPSFGVKEVAGVEIADTRYVLASLIEERRRYGETSYINFTFLQIDEKKEASTRGFDFDYKFTINLLCKHPDTFLNVYATVPLIDTNNHEPFFTKPHYTYNLISPYIEDFNRLQVLSPVIATDYDVTNNEVIFSIEKNEYFDIVYNGIVRGTLNKNHYALLTAKTPYTLISKKIELSVSVTDVGRPPKTTHAKITINPPSPPRPIFDKPFYIGHYYKNGSFVTNEVPLLQEGTMFYHTTMGLGVWFSANIEDGKIIIQKFRDIEEVFFYQQNYVALSLKATYSDGKTGLSTSSSATFIVEFHHDL